MKLMRHCDLHLPSIRTANSTGSVQTPGYTVHNDAFIYLFIIFGATLFSLPLLVEVKARVLEGAHEEPVVVF